MNNYLLGQWSNMKEYKQRNYIIKGIYNDITVSVTEQPRATFLRSTDRKGYTLKFKVEYLDKKYEAMTVIEPFYSQDEIKKIIENTKEEAKYKFADMIYEEFYN